MQEASKINTSLLSLHLCIDRLAARDRHVPYRNSKLTRLLQNALGGSGRAAVICTVRRRRLSSATQATTQPQSATPSRSGRMATHLNTPQYPPPVTILRPDEHVV